MATAMRRTGMCYLRMRFNFLVGIKICPFRAYFYRGAGGWTRTNEARSARDLQSLVIATRRLQQYSYYNRLKLINQALDTFSAGVGFDDFC